MGNHHRVNNCWGKEDSLLPLGERLQQPTKELLRGMRWIAPNLGQLKIGHWRPMRWCSASNEQPPPEHDSSQLSADCEEASAQILDYWNWWNESLCPQSETRSLRAVLEFSHKTSRVIKITWAAFQFLQFPLVPLGRPSFIFWLNLLIYIYLLDFFSSQTLRSISGQQWHRMIIVAAWPQLNRGKFPLLLLLEKQKTQTTLKVHKGIKLNWKLKIHLDELCLNAVSWQLNASAFPFQQTLK